MIIFFQWQGILKYEKKKNKKITYCISKHYVFFIFLFLKFYFFFASL
ncbi:Uncharacterized protein dnl_05330 [Desulfonema limicola]|uniref:Uncharacterized protein n=1 Tax=Desulfonema limicola TaxID=45656 RepID=A0A975GEK3_9BACT|nr:Uncharacterized protein dnl_05330 [Desulfonema limicola]